ncbi:MAG: glycosyltransferase, partial [Bdellovibrionales bacterium]|nr:glycosyltransferase [Bdellovibrionales bacterium]
MSDNQDPLVSLIIPVYNTEQYISECLESVRKQSYQNLEVIIIDDGSKDNAINICNRIAARDDRLKVVSHQRNKGLPAARNTGVRCASGKYVLHVDSDDFLAPWAVESLVRRAERDSCDVVWGAARNWPTSYISRGGRPKESLAPFTFLDEPRLWVGGGVVTFLFKSEFAHESGVIFDEKIQFGEDKCYLSAVLPRAQRIGYVWETCYFIRQTATGLTGKLTPKSVADIQKYIIHVATCMRIASEDAYNFNLLKNFEYRSDLFASALDVLPEKEHYRFFQMISSAYSGAKVELLTSPLAQPWKSPIVVPHQLHNLFISLSKGEATSALRNFQELRASYLHPAVNGRGSLDAIARTLRSAVRNEQSHARLCHELARVEERRRRFKEAEAAEKEAIRRDPTLTVAYSNLSKLLLRTGNLSEATHMAERAVELNPDDCVPLVQLAECCLHDDDLPQASACCSKALMIDSNSFAAASLLSRIQERQASIDALGTAERAVALAPDN